MTTTSEEKLLYLLKSKGAQTASEAGQALGITAPGAQQQLARLAGNGLVVAEDRKQPRGRPKRYWRLTEKGHGRFPDRHADLTLDLLQSTRAVFGAAGLDRLIAHREAVTLERYGSALGDAATLADRVARLAELRCAEGYMADWQEDGAGGYLLVENHCPICAAATMCQGLCRSEMAIFQSVLGADTRIERIDHILAGARRCAYRISPAGDSGSRQTG